ncbi:MAG: hypothetical protein RL122_477 [Pseudomonadota bacterium]|jgi:hypothetical protein
MFKVFYSWQSDLPASTNRGLILDALEKACKKLRANNGIVVEPTIDRDTLDVAGAVNIADTIFSKILDADVFVADVSLINTVPDDMAFGSRHYQRPTPNPNVLLELGYAKRHLGDEAIILVANSFYGNVEKLPFDLRGLRTLVYEAKPSDAPADARGKLVPAFEGAIKSIASVVRSDPVLVAVYPKTLSVAGQAEAMLHELIKVSGQRLDAKNITENELELVCSSVDPNGQAPLTIGDLVHGFRYANWIEYLLYYRNRSKNFTDEILMFSSFLKRDHVALLALVEHSSYFSQLRHLNGQRVSNKNLSWLSGSMWKYISSARNLRDYAEKILARRTNSF